MSWAICALFWLQGVLSCYVLRERAPRRALPPATARQVRRDRGRRRADITLALNRPGAERGHDERNWLPPSLDEFDHEETK